MANHYLLAFAWCENDIEAVLFDLDGVLYMPDSFLAEVLPKCIDEMILKGLQAEKREAMDKLLEIRSEDSNAQDHFDRLCAHFNGEPIPLIVAAAVDKYHLFKQNLEPVEGAYEALSCLKQHQDYLGVVTNGIPNKQAEKLIRLGFDGFFRYDHLEGQNKANPFAFFCSCKKDEMKPNPYLLKMALAYFGVEPENTILVGDRLDVDVFGANRLGIKSVHCRQGKYSGQTPEGLAEKLGVDSSLLTPSYTIETIRELPGLVSRL